MRIGIELFDIREGQSGGVVPLLQGVLECVFSDWPACEVTLFGTDENQNLFPSLPPGVRSLTLPRESYFSLLDVYASYFRLDVLFRSYPADAELVFPMSRQIVLIPDLQHEFYPEFFTAAALDDRRRTFGQALRAAGGIATISRHARDSIVNHPGTRCGDVFLMSPALRAERKQPSVDDLTAAERALLPAGDFFIYPANLWPHKNHRRVIRAFELFLAKSGRALEFVFTGHPEGWDELAKDFPGLPIRHLGFVRRGFLQMLLARSRALVFFSLFEGFGMPLLEAFAAGTPVACSDLTSLPEVGGDAVLACDPTDPAAISDVLARVDGDQALRASLIAKGRERLSRYSWQASAAELVAACGRVCKAAPPPTEAPTKPLHQLNRSLEYLQNDRAERLRLIEWHDKTLKEAKAEIERLQAELALTPYRLVTRKVRQTFTRLFRAG